MCQVSTTFYNAGLLAGMEVVMANRHSRVSAYIPISRDAMVSNWSNLIMANSSQNPMYVVAKTTGEELMIAIYGEKLDYVYELESKVLERISPNKPKLMVIGDNISEDLEMLLKNANAKNAEQLGFTDTFQIKPVEGIVSEAYRCKYVDGELVERITISHDKYNPIQGLIIREYSA